MLQVMKKKIRKNKTKSLQIEVVQFKIYKKNNFILPQILIQTYCNKIQIKIYNQQLFLKNNKMKYTTSCILKNK